MVLKKSLFLLLFSYIVAMHNICLSSSQQNMSNADQVQWAVVGAQLFTTQVYMDLNPEFAAMMNLSSHIYWSPQVTTDANDPIHSFLDVQNHHALTQLKEKNDASSRSNSSVFSPENSVKE